MLRFLTAGESHGPCLTAIVDGLPAGLPIDLDRVNRQLARRQRGYGRNRRMAIEQDQVEITGGLIAGRTIGAPLALRIENRDWENWRDRWAAGDLPALTVPRPGHADYAGMVKYRLEDARAVLERASARETAARVAVGAIVRQLLEVTGIVIGSHVAAIGAADGRVPDLPLADLWALAEASDVGCPSEEGSAAMHMAIDQAREAGDTLGGVFEVGAVGVPVGLGSYAQWDRRLDARLAAALMSIPAVKGVEIGPAFENARLPGSQVQDGLVPDGLGGVTRTANRAGGLEGGMTNGQPIRIRAAMKPISTTLQPRLSVDLATGEPATARYQRSDFCAVPAAAVVGEAVVAWVLAEALIEKTGGDSIEELRR